MILFPTFFLLGFFSIVSQTIILRELIISFYGNEFFIGIVLCSWMIWIAIGSYLSQKISRKKDSFFLSILFFSGVFLFLEIFLIRFSKTFTEFPGEIPNLLYSFLSAFFLPAPICLILGSWWTQGTKILSKSKKEISKINLAYLIELVGFLIGGIIFSILFAFYHEFLIANFLFFLNLILITFFLTLRGRTFLKILTIFLSIVCLFLFFSQKLDNLNKITASFRFRNQHLISSTNTQYGNISITQTEKQYNFYESGLFLGTNKETYFNEELIHLSLLSHSRAENILLVGGGFNGGIYEILKHPVKKVYYLELDPKLIESSFVFLPEIYKKSLKDEKVKIKTLDARYFLKNSKEKFDVIIINLPNPSTILLNRLYTKEFFQIVKEKLKKDGVFVTYLDYSLGAPSLNLKNLNSSLYKTLKSVFKNVFLISEEKNFFICSNKKDFSLKEENVLQNFKERKIKGEYVNEKFLSYKISNPRNKEVLLSFKKKVKTNRDFFPVAYLYQNLFWLEHFYPLASKIFIKYGKFFVALFFTFLIFLVFFFLKKNKRKFFPLFSIFVAGFSLMSFEFLVIFLYQIIIGYLFIRISLLIALFMGGMALGVYLGNKKIKEEKDFYYLRNVHLYLFFFSLFLLFSFFFLSKIKTLFLQESLLFLLAFLGGFFGSLVFPFSNKIYLSRKKDISQKTGTIYSFDLLGSSLGVISTSVFLIPLFGIFSVGFLVGILNIVLFLLGKFYLKT